VLTGLYEQLNLPRVHRISAYVTKASLDHDLVTGFANQQAELKKVHLSHMAPSVIIHVHCIPAMLERFGGQQAELERYTWVTWH
jgi:hypothetical protein